MAAKKKTTKTAKSKKVTKVVDETGEDVKPEKTSTQQAPSRW